MTSKKAAVQKFKAKSKPQLSPEELQRIAEKVAVALGHSEEDIALLLMLFDHLETLAEQPNSYIDLWCALFDIKKHLFVGTCASEDAQKQFQINAYQNRRKLLQWPNETKAKSKDLVGKKKSD